VLRFPIGMLWICLTLSILILTMNDLSSFIRLRIVGPGLHPRWLFQPFFLYLFVAFDVLERLLFPWRNLRTRFCVSLVKINKCFTYWRIHSF